MKKLSAILIVMACVLPGWQQLYAQALQWVNNPADTSAWVRGSSRTDHRRHKYVDDTVVMNVSASGANNYMYNTTPVTLSGTASVFNASFDFRIDSNSSCSDGLSFWFFTTPGTNFSQLGLLANEGGSMGFPSTVSGFVLSFKTIGCVNNVYMKSVSSTSFSWSGGAAPTNISIPTGTQSFLTDGLWHRVEVIYNAGNITTIFDGGLLTLTGYSPITGTGYFGFMATNGGGYSRKCLKNIRINTNPGSLCTGTTTTFTATPAGGTWASSTPAVATVDVTSGAVSALTAGTANISYTPLTGLPTITTVTVYAMPGAITGGGSPLCQGSTMTLSNPVAGGAWTSGTPATATITTGGVVTAVAPGTSVITYANGPCTVMHTVTVLAAPAAFTVSPATSTICGSPQLLTAPGTFPTVYKWAGPTGLYTDAAMTTPYVAGAFSPTVYAMPAATTVYTATATLAPLHNCSLTATATVNATTAPAITGTPTVCAGSATALSAGAGGTWSSSNMAVGTISATGLVTGISAGTTAISYSSGTCVSGMVVTVYAAPSAIAAPPVVCIGSTATFTATPAGGAWSSTNTASAPVSAAGVVSGLATGTAIISYTLSGGCASAATISVNALPAGISGPPAFCAGATATYTSAPAGGSWAASPASVATIDMATGIATGLAAGTATITYTLAGCNATTTITVNASPSPITAPAVVCTGSTATFTATPAGGTWSSTNTASAPVSAAGEVSGLAAGTAIIYYTLAGGCASAATVSINALPAAISGPPAFCAGATPTYTSAPAGGSWTASPASVATIDVATGIASGVAAGTATISYTHAGCTAATTITVNTSPSAITAPAVVCIGSTATFTAMPAGGTWSSTNTTSAPVSTTGVVSGLAAGTAIISYTLAGGCASTTTISINPMPAAISGPTPICMGVPVTYASTTPGGYWLATPSWTVAIDAATGIATGATSGPATISYTVGGCTVTRPINVTSLISHISWPYNICNGATLAPVVAPTGGTWSSSNPLVAPVSPAGVISGIATGTADITYSVSGACTSVRQMTVQPMPTPISGPATICTGTSALYSSSPTGGAWILITSPSVMTASTPLLTITGVGAGTGSLSYSLGACRVTQAITVVTTPGTITGATTICNGTCTPLANTTPGGTWATSDATVASIDATGNLCSTGTAGGTVTVTYSMGATCIATHSMTVAPLVVPPTGPAAICAGATAAFTHPLPGGAWSCTCPGVASVDASTGIVTGIAAGTCSISYIVGGGCAASATLTVNAGAATIAGPATLCNGASATFTNTAVGGTWTSSHTGIATIGSSTGIVTGIVPGTTTISYTLPNGCFAVHTLNVTSAPIPVSGTFTLCAGAASVLTAAPPPGTWASANTAIATVSATGIVSGISAGMAVISFTEAAGCFDTAIVTVLDTPGTITGLSPLCPGQTATAICSPAGGSWASSNAATGIITATGILTATGPGTSTISYTLPTGCMSTMVVSVHALPTMPGGTIAICEGGCTTLPAATAGTWSSSGAAITVDNITGMLCGISAGTGTVTFTASATGCFATLTATVHATPAISGGLPVLCVGLSTIFTGAPGGGTWQSSHPATATTSASGTVTGAAPGAATITYTSPTGCVATTGISIQLYPGAASGPATICPGACVAFTGAAGGTWSSSNTAAGTIDAATGLLCAIAPGATTVTHTLPGGCASSAPLTVAAPPTGITGTPAVCQGACTTISGMPGGGTWAGSNPLVCAIDASTGLLCGISPGTALLTYTMPSLCSLTVAATVHPLPAAITGTMMFCEGSATTLSCTTPGGSWSSPSATVLVNSTSGMVTGMAAGTGLISYTSAPGCVAAAVVTVNASPPITGLYSVCVNATTALSVAATGTWASFNPATGTVSATGVVTGLGSTGTDTVTISFTGTSGCVRSAVITVNALPTIITGPASVCDGQVVTQASTPAGGAWTISTTTAASVDAATGILSGHGGPATATVTYTLATGCYNTRTISAYPSPGTISGPLQVCSSMQATLSIPATGGTWGSGSTAIATIDATGLVTGQPVAAPSPVTITYTAATGCYSTHLMTAYPLPSPITGTPEVCESGGTSILSSSPAGGTWSSSNTAACTAGAATGLITGTGIGTSLISYTLGSGCFVTRLVTVHPLPSVITGPAAVCVAAAITLGATPAGGTWSTTAGIMTVHPTLGTVTGLAAGTGIVTYTAPATGCVRHHTLTVNPLPGPTGGTHRVCAGAYTVAVGSPAGGVWSSSNTAIATISASGLVHGISPGTVTITYNTGCLSTAIFTVDPTPPSITGLSVICATETTALANTYPGGGWLSSNAAVASVSAGGVVTGLSGSTVIITYMLASGCYATWPMTVKATPSPISGPAIICAGAPAYMSSSPAGGTWSAPLSSMPYGYIHPATGLVTGLSTGAIPITYTTGNGCLAATVVNIAPPTPPITGSTVVCAGSASLLSAGSAGTWSSTVPGVATIGISSGMLTGISAGTAAVTYTAGSTGCHSTIVVSVSPTPAAITGPYTVCLGSTATLSSITPGGAWTSDSTSVATISATGLVTSVHTGLTVISYTLPATGCASTRALTVSPLPAAITGTPAICSGANAVYSTLSAGGIWHSSDTAVANLGPLPVFTSTAVVTGSTPGTATLTYLFPASGCLTHTTVTVMPLPPPCAITGGGVYCGNGTGVPVGLSCSQAGIYYHLYHGAAAVDTVAGTGTALSFGYIMAPGAYAAWAVNATTGCTRQMPGTVTVSVVPPVTPSVAISASADTVCNGSPVTLTAIPINGGSAPVFEWYVNAAIAGSGPSLTVPALSGNIVSVKMISSETCVTTPSAIAEKTLATWQNVMPAIAAAALPGGTVCQGTTVTFTAAYTHGGSLPRLYWLKNGNVAGTGATHSYIPANGDAVRCMLISNARCRLADTVRSNEALLKVAAHTALHVDIKPLSTATAGATVTLQATTTPAITSPAFRWTLNGAPVSGLSTGVFSFTLGNTDTVLCTVTDAGPCSDTGAAIWTYGAPQPTGGGGPLIIHPNPNPGAFAITGSVGHKHDELAPLRITNILGQAVYTGTLEIKGGTVNAKVDVAGTLASGSYALTIWLADGPQTFKIVIVR